MVSRGKFSQQLQQIPESQTRTERRIESGITQEPERDYRAEQISSNLTEAKAEYTKSVERQEKLRRKERKKDDAGEDSSYYSIRKHYWNKVRNTWVKEGYDLIKKGYTYESVRKYIWRKADKGKAQEESRLQKTESAKQFDPKKPSRLIEITPTTSAKSLKAKGYSFKTSKTGVISEIRAPSGKLVQTEYSLRQEQEGKSLVFPLAKKPELEVIKAPSPKKVTKIGGVTVSEGVAGLLTPNVMAHYQDIRITQEAERRLGVTPTESTTGFKRKAVIREKKKVREELDPRLDTVKTFSVLTGKALLGNIMINQANTNKKIRFALGYTKGGKVTEGITQFTKVGATAFRIGDYALATIESSASSLKSLSSFVGEKEGTTPAEKKRYDKLPFYMKDANIFGKVETWAQTERELTKTALYKKDPVKADIIYSKGTEDILKAIEIAWITGAIAKVGIRGAKGVKQLIKPKPKLVGSKVTQKAFTIADTKFAEIEAFGTTGVTSADDIVIKSIRAIPDTEVKRGFNIFTPKPQITELTWSYNKYGFLEKRLTTEAIGTGQIKGYGGQAVAELKNVYGVPKIKLFGRGVSGIDIKKLTTYKPLQITPTIQSGIKGTVGDEIIKTAIYPSKYSTKKYDVYGKNIEQQILKSNKKLFENFKIKYSTERAVGSEIKVYEGFKKGSKFKTFQTEPFYTARDLKIPFKETITTPTKETKLIVSAQKGISGISIREIKRDLRKIGIFEYSKLSATKPKFKLIGFKGEGLSVISTPKIPELTFEIPKTPKIKGIKDIFADKKFVTPKPRYVKTGKGTYQIERVNTKNLIQTIPSTKQKETQIGAVLSELVEKQSLKVIPKVSTRLGVAPVLTIKQLQRQKSVQQRGSVSLEKQLQRIIFKQTSSQKLKTLQRSKSLTGTKQLQRVTSLIRTPKPPVIDIPLNIFVPTPPSPIPFYFDIDREILKKKIIAKRKKKKYKAVFGYTPSFSAVALNLKPKIITEKELNKLIKKTQTGLEIRRVVRVKSRKKKIISAIGFIRKKKTIRRSKKKR